MGLSSFCEHTSLICLASSKTLTLSRSGDNKREPELSLLCVAPSDLVADDGRLRTSFRSASFCNSSVICFFFASDASSYLRRFIDDLFFMIGLSFLPSDWWFGTALPFVEDPTLWVKVMALLLLVRDSKLADSQLTITGFPFSASSCTATKKSLVLRYGGLDYTFRSFLSLLRNNWPSIK